MKPLQLKIKGLNSFLEEQLIDFSRLTESGLFGIFGPTGSGKSSILDAITLALYGKVPRAGGQLNGIVNSQTDIVNVVYDFALAAGEDRQVYRVQRTFKRSLNKKNGSERVSTKAASVYDISDENEPRVIFEGKREVDAGIEALIGLNAEDFTRSVVLPQGSFSEFLKMTGADRAQMLERIFALEEYGEKMSTRIKQLKGAQQMQCLQLDSVLSAYVHITPEIYASREEEIDNLRLNIQEQQKLWLEVEEDYQKYQAVWNWQEELKIYQQTAVELGSRQAQNESQQQVLQNAEKAARLKPLLEKVVQREQVFHEKKLALAEVRQQQASIAEKLMLTQQKWEEARDKKDRELPSCLEKMHQLETAVKIEAQINQLQTEHRRLQEQYLVAKNTVAKKRLALDEKQGQLDQINTSLNNYKQEMEALKISPQLREKISQAYEQEKQYRQELIVNEDIKRLSSELEKNLQANQRKLSILTTRSEQEEAVLRQVMQEGQDLLNSCPGQNDDLLDLQGEINTLQKEVEPLAELRSEETRANQELTEITASIGICNSQMAVERELLQQEESLYKNSQQIIEQTRDQHMAIFLASKLHDNQACPVCGSQHHPNPASASEIMELEELTREKVSHEQQLKEQQQKVSQLEQQLQNLLTRQEYLQQAASSRLVKIAGRDIAALQKTLSSKEAVFIKLKEEILSWEEKMKDTNARQLKIKDGLAQLGKQLATQQTTWQKDNELLAAKREEALISQAKLQACQQSYQDSCLELGIEQVEARVRQMQADDRALEGLEKKSRSLINEGERLEQEKSRLQDELNQLDLTRAEIETSGRDKKQVLEQKQVDLQAICGEQKPDSALLALKTLVAAIDNNYQELNRVYDFGKNEQDKIKQQYASLDGDVRTLETVLQQEELELKAALLAHEFRDRQNILDNYLEAGTVQRIKEEIERYRDNLKLNTANMERLSEKLQGQEIAADAWQQLQLRRVELQKSLDELKKQLLLQEAGQKDMQVRLQARQELIDKKQVLEQKYGLIEDLEGLFKGKKFVDFIARRQLTYIAREASRNLKDITRGRYALEISAEGEFVIRDDYNGGVRRATHTLSGGETFLCSLALALALSSHIQLGRASLEFFFLDEGFGSLDSETLDIVIDSLESLHSEQLSVGVISHVEELKQRVPRRLIVSQAIPGLSGSTVAIE